MPKKHKELKRLSDFLIKGKNFISKDEPKQLQKVRPIITELTLSVNAKMLKRERIILPEVFNKVC